MQVINTQNSFIEIGNISISSFKEKVLKYNKIAILVDNNTKIVLPYITPLLQSNYIYIIEIKNGEKEKNINTCTYIWNKLIEYKINKNDLLINLGGGVITDMGGFVASTFKRGLDFINIPTSLLGMVDASIGGKTGINLENIKNNIGLFKEPVAVYCDKKMLKTLPNKELISGIGEVIKHALLFDKKYWEYIKNTKLNLWNWDTIISKSIDLKNKVVLSDPLENNERKKLNFGHTIGHAIESYFIAKNKKLLHGEAVAIGIICESYISYLKNKLDYNNLEKITTFILSIFNKKNISSEYDTLINLMKQDKKNNSDKINFTLLEEIGKSSIDNYIPVSSIVKSLDYYTNAY